MSLEMHSRMGALDVLEAEAESGFERDIDRPWVENAVTLTVAAFTVLFVSSVAVLMYLA